MSPVDVFMVFFFLYQRQPDPLSFSAKSDRVILLTRSVGKRIQKVLTRPVVDVPKMERDAEPHIAGALKAVTIGGV